MGIHIAVCTYYIKHKKTNYCADANTAKTEAIYEDVTNQEVENEVIEMRQNQVYSMQQ